MGTGVFSLGPKLPTHLHLVQRWRKAELYLHLSICFHDLLYLVNARPMHLTFYSSTITLTCFPVCSTKIPDSCSCLSYWRTVSCVSTLRCSRVQVLRHTQVIEFSSFNHSVHCSFDRGVHTAYTACPTWSHVTALNLEIITWRVGMLSVLYSLKISQCEMENVYCLIVLGYCSMYEASCNLL